MSTPISYRIAATARYYDVRRGLRDRWGDAFRAAYQLPADYDLGAEWRARGSWGLDAIATEIDRCARIVARREHPELFEGAEPAEEVARPARGIDPRLIDG